MLDEPTLLGASILGALILYFLFGGADFGGGVWHLMAYRAACYSAAGAGGAGYCADLGSQPRLVDPGGRRPVYRLSVSIRGHRRTRLRAVAGAPLLAIVAAQLSFRLSLRVRRSRARAPWVEHRLRDGDPTNDAGAAWHDRRCDCQAERAATDRLSGRGPWLAPFPISAGLFALALCAFLAAVYLTVEAEGDRELADDFRWRAFVSGLASGALALASFLLSAEGAPRVHAGLSIRRWSWPLPGLTALVTIDGPDRDPRSALPAGPHTGCGAGRIGRLGLGRFAVPVSNGARPDALVGATTTAADTDHAPCGVERRRARAVSVAAPSLSRVQVTPTVTQCTTGARKLHGRAPWHRQRHRGRITGTARRIRGWAGRLSDAPQTSVPRICAVGLGLRQDLPIALDLCGELGGCFYGKARDVVTFDLPPTPGAGDGPEDNLA